jgi:hypothetical protein
VSFESSDHPVLVVAARHGLPAELAPPMPAVTLSDDDADGVRVFARTDRIAGLMAGAMRTGEVVTSADTHALLIDDWHRGLHGCVLVEALLVRVAARLDARHVRWAATKGSAVAHLDYPDPAWRAFADVDLVVHPDDWTTALRIMPESGDGHDRRHTRAFTARYGKGETVVVDDMEVDLHLRFAVGRFGVRSRPADCFDHLDAFELAGRPTPALAAEYRLLHACCHAVLGGNPGLRAVRDVAQIIATHPDCVDETWRVARRWHAEAVVAAAIVQTWQQLRLAPDHDVLRRAVAFEPSRADRAALLVFATDPGFRRQALTALGALPWRERPRFLWAARQTSREFHR